MAAHVCKYAQMTSLERRLSVKIDDGSTCKACARLLEREDTELDITKTGCMVRVCEQYSVVSAA